jgi:HSP20 family protein
MTTLIRWDPIREAATMHNELSRLMNGLFESGGGRQAQEWVPALDVWETQDDVVYAFDLPGIPQDGIAVEVEDGALTVSAAREREQDATGEGYRRFERRFGSFTRSVALPQGASEDTIKASYTDGVLEIRVPKPEQQKPKRIEVSAGGSAPQTIEGTFAGS